MKSFGEAEAAALAAFLAFRSPKIFFFVLSIKLCLFSSGVSGVWWYNRTDLVGLNFTWGTLGFGTSPNLCLWKEAVSNSSGGFLEFSGVLSWSLIGSAAAPTLERSSSSLIWLPSSSWTSPSSLSWSGINGLSGALPWGTKFGSSGRTKLLLVYLILVCSGPGLGNIGSS